mmetsp:Transcript_1022/g.3415  ORF Transcript_1022/g.3415 Transcript_1022/m.3415 type:complete len:496 (-) Transcript_1022:237-1724(-)
MAAASRAYDLVVIGAGSGGLQAAWDAAQSFKAKVAVVDVQTSHGPPHFSAVGGTCVNVGCVPKKLFMQGALYREHFKDAKGFGWQIDADALGHDWKAMVKAKDKAIQDINDSYMGDMFKDSQYGIDFFCGWASFTDPHTIAVREAKAVDSKVLETLTATKSLVATGGWPFIPSFPGSELAITSNEAFYLPECPKKTLVVGGGFIAVEFAGIFESFRPRDGEVHLAYRGEIFLRGFDMMCREELKTQMEARGIKLHFKADPTKIEKTADGRLKVTFNTGAEDVFDCVMYATGRKPNTANLGLEKAGVATRSSGGVIVDEFSKTNVDHIFAIGDVTERIQLTPVAIHEGTRVAKTAFGNEPTAVDHANVASAVFSIPQIGTCGLTEEEAAAKYTKLRVYKNRGTPLMHQLTGNAHKKYNMKVIVSHDDDLVVGVHLVYPEAAEVIQLVGVAMKCGVKFQHFRSTIGVHPTTSEGLCDLEPSYYYLDGEKHETKPAKL